MKVMLLTVALVAIMILIIPPGSFSTRHQARRSDCMYKIRSLMIAALAYETDRGELPGIARDADGRPRRSWRVDLLPYLGHQDLYAAYALDEPWDSPNNLALLERMPEDYVCPRQKDRKVGLTTYARLEFNGKPDSHSFVVVESPQPVPWTKPEDLSAEYLIHMLSREGTGIPWSFGHHRSGWLFDEGLYVPAGALDSPLLGSCVWICNGDLGPELRDLMERKLVRKLPKPLSTFLARRRLNRSRLATWISSITISVVTAIWIGRRFRDRRLAVDGVGVA